jgi:hypothetical protein
MSGQLRDLELPSAAHAQGTPSGKLQRWPLVTRAPGNDAALQLTASSSAIEPLIALDELCMVCVPDFSIRRQLAHGSLVAGLDQHVKRGCVPRGLARPPVRVAEAQGRRRFAGCKSLPASTVKPRTGPKKRARAKSR